MHEKEKNFDTASDILGEADFHFAVADVGDGSSAVSMHGEPRRMARAIARGLCDFMQKSEKEPGSGGVEILTMIFKLALEEYSGASVVMLGVSPEGKGIASV